MIVTVTFDLDTASIAEIGAKVMATSQEFTDLINQIKDQTTSLNDSATKVAQAITDLEGKLAAGGTGGTGGTNTGMTAEEEDAALQQLKDLKAAQDSLKATMDGAVSSIGASGTPTPPPSGTPTPAPGTGPVSAAPSGPFPGGTTPGSTTNAPPPHQGP